MGRPGTGPWSCVRREEAPRDERAGPRPDRGAGPRHSRRLAAEDVKCWAGKAHQGADPAIRVPIRGKHLRGRRHNRGHAKISGLGERAVAILKSWRLLRKLRCSTTRITAAVRAVVTLELACRLGQHGA